MRYETNYDTDVQKPELFNFLTVKQEPDQTSFSKKTQKTGRDRTIENKREIVHKLIKHFKSE
jgi:hypothetical protein